MYAEWGLLFPSLHSFPISTELHPLQKPTSRSNQVETIVSEYDFGGEGDLFKAPEPIMEEPVLGLDPMTLVSMINSDEDITTKSIKFSDISSIQTEHLLSETFTLSEYDKGGEDDLFKAPESIMEETLLGYDPMTVAVSMTSRGEDAISAQMIKAADIESFQSDHLLSEVVNECKDLMTKSATEESFPKVLDVKIPAIMKDEGLNVERDGLITGCPMQNSFSYGSLNSKEWINGGALRPSFLDFQTMNFGADLGMRRAFSEGDIQTMDLGAALGMRRAFSEGDIQTLSSYNPLGLALFEKTLTEDRKLRLSRYRNKKTKRNFGRKIKYACRKALADSQPRVRGRFAKTEEAYASNDLKWDECKYSTEKQVKGGPDTTSYDAVEEIISILPRACCNWFSI